MLKIKVWAWHSSVLGTRMKVRTDLARLLFEAPGNWCCIPYVCCIETASFAILLPLCQRVRFRSLMVHFSYSMRYLDFWDFSYQIFTSCAMFWFTQIEIRFFYSKSVRNYFSTDQHQRKWYFQCWRILVLWIPLITK